MSRLRTAWHGLTGFLVDLVLPIALVLSVVVVVWSTHILSPFNGVTNDLFPNPNIGVEQIIIGSPNDFLDMPCESPSVPRSVLMAQQHFFTTRPLSAADTYPVIEPQRGSYYDMLVSYDRHTCQFSVLVSITPYRGPLPSPLPGGIEASNGAKVLPGLTFEQPSPAQLASGHYPVRYIGRKSLPSACSTPHPPTIDVENEATWVTMHCALLSKPLSH